MKEVRRTQAIKERLTAHFDLLTKRNNVLQELEYMRETIGTRGQALTGMPIGKGGHSDPTLSFVVRIDDIERRLAMIDKEIIDDWAELEPLVERLQPFETLIIRLRYLYGADWKAVCAAVYGKRDDYEYEIDSYMNRVFKAHHHALDKLQDML